MGAVIAKEKYVLVDSLQKQEDRDAQGRFLKGRSGNPEGRFRKGRSGNPKGRPAGARNKATQTAELLLDGEAEALTRRAVEIALAGDGMALRLCLDRIIPPRRGRPVQLGLPPVRGAADLGGTMAAITNAAASGAITPRRGGGAGAGGRDLCPGGRDQRFREAVDRAGRSLCRAEMIEDV
jgi:hypothetical protein